MMITIELIKRFWWVPCLLVYTIAVVIITARFLGAGDGSKSSQQFQETMQQIHDEELKRIADLHEQELEERDVILDEYRTQVEQARQDYWNTIGHIETQIRAQRQDILKRIADDPDAAAKILEDRYGLVYVP